MLYGLFKLQRTTFESSSFVNVVNSFVYIVRFNFCRDSIDLFSKNILLAIHNFSRANPSFSTPLNHTCNEFTIPFDIFRVYHKSTISSKI